jgi:hypothetical protein
MPAWAIVTITLGATAIAVAGTLLSSWLQDRRAQSRATAEARTQRVRASADVVAGIEILLSDADPDRLAINVDRDAPLAAYVPLERDWLRNLRPALATFALADESPDVRTLGRQLETAIHNSFGSTRWLLRDLTNPMGGGDLVASRTTAVEKHAEARQLSERLMSAVRGEHSPQERKRRLSRRERRAARRS